jgi:KDO2-lipid IV(A) lauroyltransferase
MKRIKHLLELLLFALVCLPVALMPLPLARRAARLAGLAAYHIWGSRRRIAVANVRGAVERGALTLPTTPERIVRENFMNMARSAVEVLKVYLGLGRSIIDRIEVEGIEHFEEAKRSGKGVLLVTGHCGNWELMSVAVTLRLGFTYGIARRQSNPFFDRLAVRTRERFGGSVIYKEGALRKTLQALKDGATVGIVIDQAVLPEEGVLIDFLRAPAWTTRTPSALARRTGAAVIPEFLHREGDRYILRLHPPLALTDDDTENTRLMSATIEDYIRRHPADWLWIHRRWKRAPPIQPTALSG